MFALIGNLDLMEVLVIAVAAIMIFGKDLPEVAVKAAAQVVRLRRAVTKMWREAGIEDEIRRVQREVEHARPRIPPVDSMIGEADRRRAQRARELRELAPRPENEPGHEDAGRDEGWVRGEGDVDDGFHADPGATPADPFGARREPDGEVQAEPQTNPLRHRGPDPDPTVDPVPSPSTGTGSGDESGTDTDAVADGESAPGEADSKESA